ncbi:MAG: hypothetical protein WKG00_14390 [Polyangiaceae bacterium]
MTAETLAAWLLSVMLTSAPPGRSRFPPSARETAEVGRDRYAAIARDIAEVAMDPAEPAVFDGPRARERTAALVLAIAWHESGFRRDVDLGLGPFARGTGRYHCIMQVAVERGKRASGWTGKELVEARPRCIRAALDILQRARGACRPQGPDAWMRLYVSGHCTRGRKAAEERLGTARRWLSAYPLPGTTQR